MYLEDRFLGECFVEKFSLPYNSFGTGTFTINATALSTVRKVLLMAGQCGNTNNNLTVTLNGLPYSFSNSTRVGSPFDSVYGSSSSIHSIDITADIVASTTNYTFTVPAQASTVSQRYTDFWFIFEFDNSGLDVVNVCHYLNTQSMVSATAHTYNIPLIIPISTAGDVGVSLVSGYICNTVADDETIRINGTTVGNSIGSTTGDGQCGGITYRATIGTFHYGNSVLTGTGDSVANQAMTGLDALSKATALVNNGDTLVVTQFNASSSGNYSNNCFGWIIVYTDTQIYPFECSAPAVTMSNITNTTARASWVSGAPCGGVNADYNVQYRAANSPTWIVVPVSLVSLYDITGLTTGTNYVVQIVPTACGNPPAVCARSLIIPFSTT